MFWPLACLLILPGASISQDPSSVSDAVRVGATILSRFLNQPSLFFPGIHKPTKVGGRNELTLTMLKLMGIDSTRISDFAFDGILSLMHLMSEVLLTGERNIRKGRQASKDFSIFHFILRQPKVVNLLTQMQDPGLIDLLLKESAEKLNSEEKAECVRLLICKTKPFVRGMQRSLRFFMKRENISGSVPEGALREDDTCPKECKDEETEWEKANLEARMYFFVPSLSDVIENGDRCDQDFPNCVY